MALSKTENTSTEVMENFKISGLLPDYVNINDLHFMSHGQVVLTLDIFGDEQARENGEKFNQVIQGVNLPKSKMDEIKADLFSRVYPYLIAEIEVKNLLKERDSIPTRTGEEIDEYEQKIKDIYLKNGLDSPF